MTHSTSKQINDHTPLAILLALIASFFYAVMAVFVKMLVKEHVHIEIMVFFRFVVSFILLGLVFLIAQKGLKSLYTQQLSLHIFRSLFALLAILFYFLSLNHIPIVNAVLLSTTYPLFIPILALLFLRVETNYKVYVSLALGFLGIILILRPEHSLLTQWSSLLALLSGFCIAVSMLSVRRLNRNNSLFAILFYYYIFSTLISGVWSIFDWKTPTVHQFLLLLAVGLCGTIYQAGLVIALKFAHARIVSSLMYTTIVFSGLIGWYLWHVIPDKMTLWGIIIVCTGGILTIIFQRPKATEGIEGYNVDIKRKAT